MKKLALMMWTVVIIAMTLLAGCGADGGGTSVSVSDVGNVEGTVTDATSGAVVSGATVQVGDKSATTNSSGVYSVTDLDVGSRTITATKTGYQSYNGTVTVTKGTTVTQNIQMTGGTSGSLDTTFGTGGIVTTSIGSIGSSRDASHALAIQSDGKIVAAGYSSNGSNLDFAIVRYNTDGTLDSTFGTGGKVTTAIGSSNDVASALAIQFDGKIMAAGYSSNGSNYDFALARYNTDGTLDSTFGTGGKVTTVIGSFSSGAYALALQPDGKIVVAGDVANGSSDSDLVLVRYNTDGSLDTSFGTTGKITTAISSTSTYPQGLAIQSDGKIVAAGYSNNGSNYDFALVRYNTDGLLDTSFGTAGKVTTAIGSSYDTTYDLGIQSDGKIVVAGISNNGSNTDFALVRYNTDGTLDSTFGTGGKVTTAIGSSTDASLALGIQSDGKIVVAGVSDNGSNQDFALARYNIDGSLDTSFGTAGKVTTAIGSSNDLAWNLGIQSDGKIVVAGYFYNGSNTNFAIVRYLP